MKQDPVQVLHECPSRVVSGQTYFYPWIQTCPEKHAEAGVMDKMLKLQKPLPYLKSLFFCQQIVETWMKNKQDLRAAVHL